MTKGIDTMQPIPCMGDVVMGTGDWHGQVSSGAREVSRTGVVFIEWCVRGTSMTRVSTHSVRSLIRRGDRWAIVGTEL